MIISPEDSGPSGSTSYRLKRGTKLSDIPAPTTPLSSLDGPFQLAEYLSLKVRHDPHNVKALVEVPSEDGSVGGKSPERDVWIYEHLRRIPIDLTALLTQLLGICTRETCPQMKADEWLYLCVAHGGGGTEECCAIDYILHTLDSTTALLNSTKSFPSRLNIPTASLSHFPSLFRRLSRIFSHAYYHHREAFSLAESETSLYARFVALCETYELVGPGLLIIPREAIGDAGQDEEEEDEESDESEEEDEREPERDRGREVKGEEKRTQSLDRGLRTNPSVSPENPSRSRPPVPSVQVEDPFGGGTVREESGGMTMGRGTLGRGKQSRGTMLWSSDAPPVPNSSTATDDSELGLTRSESIESVVHIGRDETDREDEPEIEAVPVPNDEIELLEEEGKLPVQPSVAPLPEPRVKESEGAEAVGQDLNEEDGMEEVKLGDEDSGINEAPVEAEPEQTALPEETPSTAIEGHQDSPTMSPSKAKVAESSTDSEGLQDEEEKQEILTPPEEEKIDEANEEAREAI